MWFKFIRKYLFYILLELTCQSLCALNQQCFETGHNHKRWMNRLHHVRLNGKATYHNGRLKRDQQREFLILKGPEQGMWMFCLGHKNRSESTEGKLEISTPGVVCVWTRGLDFHCSNLLFTIVSTDCHPSLSYSLTKWNFHFLVCKWVFPSAFVWYLFIQFMWQEQCTLINISAFTSL